MENNKNQLIIGAGEVGSSLFRVLEKNYPVFIYRKTDQNKRQFQIIHIAYPYSKSFVRDTKKYIKKFSPKLAIIHSTIPIGSTAVISPIAVHSPVRGMHPSLDNGIKTFVKYFGGPKARSAAKIFSDIGIRTVAYNNAKTTELLKILDTSYYAWNIVFAKEAKRICVKLDIDFDQVYSQANKSYNEGYSQLGIYNVVRPILKASPGPIGGHCLIDNCRLLDDWLTNTIKKRNTKY